MKGIDEEMNSSEYEDQKEERGSQGSDLAAKVNSDLDESYE